MNALKLQEYKTIPIYDSDIVDLFIVEQEGSSFLAEKIDDGTILIISKLIGERIDYLNESTAFDMKRDLIKIFNDFSLEMIPYPMRNIIKYKYYGVCDDEVNTLEIYYYTSTETSIDRKSGKIRQIDVIVRITYEKGNISKIEKLYKNGPVDTEYTRSWWEYFDFNNYKWVKY